MRIGHRLDTKPWNPIGRKPWNSGSFHLVYLIVVARQFGQIGYLCFGRIGGGGGGGIKAEFETLSKSSE